MNRMSGETIMNDLHGRIFNVMKIENDVNETSLRFSMHEH